MLWIPFAVIPFFLGAWIATVRDVSRWRWLLFIGVIACVEVIVIGKPSASWNSEQMVTLWVLGVFLPWAVIACLIAFAPYPKKRMFIAIGLPIVYFLNYLFSGIKAVSYSA